MHGERFTGFVRDGKVRIDQPDRWKALLEHMEGKPVEVSLGRLRANRSLKANAYLWAIYRYIADWSGHDENEVHDAMKGMFLPMREVTLLDGNKVMTLGSTRTLDSVEFGEFVTRVKVWAQGQGIVIPEPEEVGAL